jgi:hypothetical protein
MNPLDIQADIDELRARLAALRDETDQTRTTAEAIGVSLESIQASLQSRHRQLDTPPSIQGAPAAEAAVPTT